MAEANLVDTIRKADASWRPLAERHVGDMDAAGTLARALLTVLDWVASGERIVADDAEDDDHFCVDCPHEWDGRPS